MRTFTPALIALVLMLGLAGCADKKPARINIDPPQVVTDTSYFRLHAAAVNAKGEPIEGVPLAWSGGPAGVLEVSADGNLRCAKTGDATLTLSAGAVSQRVDLKCRIPVEIVMPPEVQVVLGAAPVALHARALGEGQMPLDDVTIQVTSADPSIVSVDGDRVKGLAVGKTSLKSTAGGLTTVTPVAVVEKIVSEPLTLKDGASKTFALQPAYYLVTVDLTVDEHLKQGVTVSWAGTACENQPEKASHRFNCRVLEPATMTVTNPKLMGVGATVSGTVNVYRVPG
jgi:hypothetical protein